MNIEGTGTLRENGEKLILLYTNADCLTNKMAELNILMQQQKPEPDIVVITEAKPKNARYRVNSSEFNIQGYYTFTSDFNEEGTRGIVVYVRQHLQVEQKFMEKLFKEAVFIEIKGNAEREKLLIAAVYRSPNSSAENDALLCDVIDGCCAMNGKTILVGDFNYSHIVWQNGYARTDDKRAALFVDCMGRNGLVQHVDRPTRYRDSQESHILDLVISDGDHVDNIKYMSPLGKSDHVVLKFECEVKYVEVQPEHKFNWNRGDYDGLREFVGECWKGEKINSCGDVEQLWSKIKSDLETGIAKFIPKLTNWRKKIRWTHPVNAAQRAMIRRKHRLWNRMRETGSEDIKRKYKKQNNKVREASREFEKGCKERYLNRVNRIPKNFGSM